MKLVCVTRAYNNNTLVGHDGLTDIDRFMRSVVRYCDGLVLFDNGSTDKTRDVVGAYGDKIEIQVPSEPTHREGLDDFHGERCLLHCARMDADWILFLNPTEVIQAPAERGAIKALCEANELADYYKFLIRRLWKTDRFYRSDDAFNVVEARLFKASDDLSFSGGVPILKKDGHEVYSMSFLKILSYELSTGRHIKNYKRRCREMNIDYNLDETNLHLSEAKPEWFNNGQFGPDAEVFSKSN